jgi:hypothetical protein
MRKFLQLFFLNLLFACIGLNAEESSAILQEELPAMDYFYVDQSNSTNDFIRLCVPIDYPNWFALPTSSIESIKQVGTETIDGRDFAQMQIRFNDFQLNSILDAYNSLLDEHERFKLRIRLPKPWLWTKCAKCQLGVNGFITVSILATCALAGVTGPGALAVWQAIIVGKFGTAAWEAVKAVALSATTGSIAEKICIATGHCR